jgi:hypothetical protein
MAGQTPRPNTKRAGMLETTQDVAEARARLERRSPEVLVTFITSLAQDAGPVGEQVRTFIVGDDLAATVESLRERIATLGVADGAAPGYAAGAAVGQRLGYILEAIETLVLPVDSRRAFELLVLLIERDGDAMEQCGDHHDAVACEIERAADLIEQAISRMSSEGVLLVLKRLTATDEYGTRQPLAAVVNSLVAAGTWASGERPGRE